MNDKDMVLICSLVFVYIICLIELARVLYPKFRTWYIRWSVLRKTRLKTVDVNKATEKDVEELGRVVGPYISNDHKEPKPYLINNDPKYLINNDPKLIKPYLLMDKDGAVIDESNYVSHSSVMKTLRNKKTGVVIICPWDLVKIQDTYGKDWQIIEAAIKG